MLTPTLFLNNKKNFSALTISHNPKIFAFFFNQIKLSRDLQFKKLFRKFKHPKTDSKTL